MAIVLPEKSKPFTTIQDFTFLIYGARKIGKTTIFSEFEDPFFFMFEPGGKALSIKQVFMKDWNAFLETISLLEKRKGYCKTVIIDTGYMAYERCFEYSLKRLGIINPQDKSFGAAWKFIDKEFRDAHMRLFDLGVSIGVTAHSEIKEIKNRDGTTFNRLDTQLSAQAYRYYCGTMDVIGYYQKLDSGERVLQIQSDPFAEAGSRIENHFMYQNTNRPMDFIPMGKNKKEAYANLVKAFNNEFSDPKKSEASAKVASAKVARK